MNEKPILFSGEMVRAILAGRKTQTRRIVRYPHSWLTPYAGGNKAKAFKLFHEETERGSFWNCADLNSDGGYHWQCGDERLPQNYQVGDLLWLKETHLPKASGTIYRTDFDSVEAAGIGAMYGGWKPSIFCKREYSRITLEIVSVRVERLQDISEPDAISEGLYPNPLYPHAQLYTWDGVQGNSNNPRYAYQLLWGSINGAGSWSTNPWVWVVAFKQV